MTCQVLPTGLRSELYEQSPADVQAAELARLAVCLPVEREWMQVSRLVPYIGRSCVVKAIQAGELVPVPEDEALPYRQYLQDRSDPGIVKALPETRCSIPYLRPRALAVLNWAAYSARDEYLEDESMAQFMSDRGLASLRYSITSMTRTRRYQQELTRAGKLATGEGDSTHSYGLAFDIDHSGYYATLKGRPELGEVSVNYASYPELYSDVPIHVMQNILEVGRHNRILNYITELPGGRGCWHVAVNPQGVEPLLSDFSLADGETA